MSLDQQTRQELDETKRLLNEHQYTRSKPVWKQYLAAFLASIISFSSGCVSGWSSPAVPELLSGNARDLDGIRALTVDEASWVASLINLGAFFGSIPAGYLSFKWGRKICLLSLSLPIIVGWLFILFNNDNVWFLYIGRFISGLSYGSLNVALPIYNNEICIEEIRGRIGILYDLMQCVGLVWVYGFGAFLNLYWVTVLCLAVPLVFLLSFVWMPESPLYLIKKGRIEDAVNSIRWLHGENCNVELELTKINQALREGMIDGKTDSFDEDYSILNCFNVFYNSLSKVTIKAVLIAFFMFVLQRTCGATMVQYYADSIFELAQSSLSPSYATVIIGIVSLLSSIVSVLTVDFVGRRILLIGSFLIMTLSMVVFVIYLATIFNGFESAIDPITRGYYGLIPAVALCVFVAMFRLGVSPIPWFMAPEIIPTEAQKWASSTIVCITWGTSFILSKCFLPAIQAFGQIPVYTFFLLVCFIGVIYTWLFIPETKNKTREQIQRELGASSGYEEI